MGSNRNPTSVDPSVTQQPPVDQLPEPPSQISEPLPEVLLETKQPDEHISKTSDSCSPITSSPNHQSSQNHHAPIQCSYDGTQSAGYQVLASLAVFVGTPHENAAYQAFHEIDDETETYGFETLSFTTHQSSPGP